MNPMDSYRVILSKKHQLKALISFFTRSLDPKYRIRHVNYTDELDLFMRLQKEHQKLENIENSLQTKTICRSNENHELYS